MKAYDIFTIIHRSNDSRLEAVEKRLGHLEEKSNQLEYDLKRVRKKSFPLFVCLIKFVIKGAARETDT